MKDIIMEYEKEAAMLEKRSRELSEMIKKEQDVFKLHELEKRKKLLDLERYEILRDIRDMRSDGLELSEVDYAEAG